MMITLPITSPMSLRKFLKEHKDLIYSYVLQEVEEGINSKTDRIDLLKFGGTQYRAVLLNSEYATALSQAQDFFIEQEMYEEAGECRDLLIKLNLEIEFQTPIKS